MKKVKSLLLMLLIMIIICPFYVRAEEGSKEPVNVYLFYGDGCPHCEAAMEWFDSIEEEYGDYFDLQTYEVWYSEENSLLMEEVGAFLGDEASGVPYIIVGDYSYPDGFGADSIVDQETGKTAGDQLVERIMEIYESDNRYDVMNELANKPDYSSVVGVVSMIVIVGFVAMVIIARKQSR